MLSIKKKGNEKYKKILINFKILDKQRYLLNYFFKMNGNFTAVSHAI